MRKMLSKIDKPLFVLMIISLIFGVIMVGSASSLKSYMKFSENYFYFKRQLLFIGAGMLCYLILLCVPLKRWRKYIPLAIIGIIGALIYVLVNQKVMNGISGWMFIGGFGIQPSEFAKTVLILFLAYSFERLLKYPNINNVIKLIPFLVPAIFIGLIYKQPDLGTMLILVGITAVIFLVVPYDKKWKLIICSFTMILIGIVALAMALSGKGLSDAQKERFNYKAPCTRYRQKTGYQVCNGYIAINSAPILPTNFGNSRQKYLYLPEAHTDFIYAIVVEEMGLVVGMLIILFYYVIIYRIIRIGKRSFNLQGTIICYGVASYIALHVIINLGGLLGIIPLTGVPLPFYSYGGSFMINLLICLGLVQRVCIENKTFEQKHLIK